MNAAEYEILSELKKQLDEAPHGAKEDIYKRGYELMGISRATLLRKLQMFRLEGVRQKRSDAGIVKLSREDATELSAMLMAGFRQNKKKIISIKTALKTLRANKPGFATCLDESTGELVNISNSACANAMRTYRLHPDQLNKPAPMQHQKSLHPNDVWLIDASISTLFYVPDGEGVADMSPALFYKNKPENFEKIKRQRLTRYVITDHCSGAIFVHYVPGGESIENMAESLLACMQKRVNTPLYGVPFHLMFDPGSAGLSGAFGNLIKRLQITPVVNRAGNPRASGQVENAHNIVELNFESTFKLQKLYSIEDINKQAALFMKWYNADIEHSRHKLTRTAKWMTIRPEQLRIVDADLARSMLTHKSETRIVGDALQISFENRDWDVSNVPQVIIGEKLQVTYNPFDRNSLYVVTQDADRNELLIPIQQVEKDEHGFSVGAALIGREYKQPKDTIATQNKKMVVRMMTGASTDEEAERLQKKNEPAFGGSIDPYKHMRDAVENQPDYLHKQGQELEVTTAIESKTLRLLTHFEAAREMVDCGAPMTLQGRSLIKRLYPDGVPEEALPELKQKLIDAAKLRVVHGD